MTHDSTDHIDLEATTAAIAAADRALDPLRRVRVARAKHDGYLERRFAADERLANWWRAWSAWCLTGAVYAERLDDHRAIVEIDLGNIRSQLTEEGRAAVHALFR